MTPVRRGALAVPLALAAAVALLAAVLLLVTVRTDMAAFLPEGSGDAALVLNEVRSGAATGLVLAGVEGAPVGELARIARGMQGRLEPSPLFSLVAGGSSTGDRGVLFTHRYLLSPAVTPDAFTQGALRTDLQRLLGQMGGAMGGLAAGIGVADPVGAFLRLVTGLAGGTRVRVVDGAWVAADGSRALLLLRTRAAGMDIAAQDAALTAVRTAFEAESPGGARLVMAGPAVFSRDAARLIRGDVERISLFSTVLVVGLLWWRFRSVLVLGAIAAPVVASVAVAACVVQAVFGSVHGVALGFGATMLGVSVDYPVLMIGHRKRGEAAGATRRRIGRAFGLAVACALLGLAAMVFSSFPGLAQLGVFAAAGLLSCAMLTWFALPPLIVRAELAPVASGEEWLPRVEGWRRWRGAGLVLAAAAALVLLEHGVRWQGDLQALSPVPPASLALDREMREQVGAGDAGPLLLVQGSSAEAVLRTEEDLQPALDGLRARGAIGGAEMASRLLPSGRTQAARRAALPDAEELAARLAAASAGLPFRAGAFGAFKAAVAATRTAPDVTVADFAGTALGARLAPLLLRRGDGWVGTAVLRDVTDEAAVRTAVGATGAAGGGRAVLVDIRRELGSVLSEATGRAWWWLGGSAAVAASVLLAGLRDWRLCLRVVGAVGTALLVTVAALAAAGVRLSPIHLVALQLVAGVGVDYALFFARRQLDGEERARTLRTLVTCNAMTLLTFGLLAGCQTPLLRDIGVTVALGAVLAMVFGFLWAGERV